MSQAALQILDQVLVVAFLAIAIFAALGDWSRFVIPNRLSLAVIGLWVCHAVILVLQGQPPLSILWAVAGALAVFLVCFALFAIGASLLGGGDVKFLTAAALWAGPDFIVPFIFIVALAGGLLSVAFLIPGIGNQPVEEASAAGAPAVAVGGLRVWLRQRLRRKVPYCVAITIGCVVTSIHLSKGLLTGG